MLLSWSRNASRTLALTTASLFGSQFGLAQQWQPTRIAPSSQAQPLSSATHSKQSTPASNGTAYNPALAHTATPGRREGYAPSDGTSAVTQQLGSGIVLRWRTSSSNKPTNYSVSHAANISAGNGMREAGPMEGSSQDYRNPLRSGTEVQYRVTAAEQTEVRTVSDIHPIDRFQSPERHYRTAQSVNFQETASDPLDEAELAPQPPTGQGNLLPELPSIEARPPSDPPSFPPQLGDEVSPADRPSTSETQPEPSVPERLPLLPKEQGPKDTPNSEEDDSPEALEELLKEARKASTPDCVTQREQLKGQPLSSISLDVSPKLSDGLRSIKKQSEDSQDTKKEVNKKSLLREWTNYRGESLGSGRMIDLRFGNVILDVDGREQAIPVANLSDVDMNYVSELWNLPFRCGSGFEALQGRQFVNSTVQWKASGACHNPLYFEQVQLERYGHDAGPFVQPLISSAHFLLSIPMMPYKMAINPPNECQYALGYYRPGNCAPYMVQPFPWSVKAGLVQAGFWTGVSALVP